MVRWTGTGPGSIRHSSPLCGSVIQTAPAPTAIELSDVSSCTAPSFTWRTTRWLPAASCATWPVAVFWIAHVPTGPLATADALRSRTVCTTRLLVGSIRDTDPSASITQTPCGPTAIW